MFPDPLRGRYPPTRSRGHKEEASERVESVGSCRKANVVEEKRLEEIVSSPVALVTTDKLQPVSIKGRTRVY